MRLVNDTNNASITVTEDKGAGKLIRVTDDVSIKMRWPTFESYTRMGKTTVTELSEDLMLDCIETIYDADQSYTPGKDFTREELIEWFGTMGEPAEAAIEAFMKSVPEIELVVPIRCPACGTEDTLKLRGLDDFLE